MSTVTDRVTDLFALNREEKRLVSAAQQDTIADLRAHENGILAARPRDAVEAEARAMITKAAGLENTPQAKVLIRQAQDLLTQNPQAPRRAESGAVAKAARIAKAAGLPDDLMVAFDQYGQPFGVFSASMMTPVTCDLASVMKTAGDGSGDDDDSGDGSELPDMQARRTSPPAAPGTTGLGMPRGTAQQQRPGDMGRVVIRGVRRPGR